MSCTYSYVAIIIWTQCQQEEEKEDEEKMKLEQDVLGRHEKYGRVNRMVDIIIIL